jgi:hypothetical protein
MKHLKVKTGIRAPSRIPVPQLLKEADHLGAKTIRLAEALRLEAKGLGRIFFEQGRGIWCPLEVKAS